MKGGWVVGTRRSCGLNECTAVANRFFNYRPDVLNYKGESWGKPLGEARCYHLSTLNVSTKNRAK